MTIATQPFLHGAYTQRCQALSSRLMSWLPMERIKTVVDLACGTGLVGKAFEAAGCQVTYVDGREENLAPLEAEGRKVYQLNVHSSAPLPRADLILCLGLLYHSEEPQRILNYCAEIAPIIALESLCLDLSGVWCLLMMEDTTRIDQAVDGGACRPSLGWLYRALGKAGYSNIQDFSNSMPQIEPTEGSSGYLYNWRGQQTGDSYQNGYALRKLLVGQRKEAF